MSTSHSSSKQGGAGCGCGSSGTAGTALAAPCSCAGAGCAACSTAGFVRPRFFAGQLLTEDDLQAMADYIVSKNRLHNRHFMGDGVVCGLAVTCNPCGGGKVVVHPGHALDCCGNDLVLECAVELDANAMVRDLRRSQLAGHDCGDPCADVKADGKPGANDTKNLARHYDLYVRYSEQASEPVAPYATDEACGSGCEYSRVREGVSFELRCADDMDAPDGFIKRVLACLKGNRTLLQALTKLFESTATGADVANAREMFLDVLDSRATLTDCQLRASVIAVAIPAQGAPIDAARTALLTAFVELLRDCACQAVLPPCAPCDDTGVLLARIEMRDCVVQDICNLERKFVLTGPNLRYWLPLDLIGEVMEEACCGEIDIRTPTPTPTPTPPPPPPPITGIIARSNTGAGNTGNTGTSTGTSAGSTKGNDALLDQLGAYMMTEFGLSKNDAADLAAMGDSVGKMHKAGAFDNMAPVKLGRMVKSIDLGNLLGGGGKQSGHVNSSRDDFKAENAKTMATMEQQNSELRSQLAQVMERLNKLEGAPAPAPAPDTPAGGVKKSRK